MGKVDNAITGACGEHYVASYLSGFRLLVAMPRAGIPAADLFVSKVGNGPALRIQVKTGTQSFRESKADGPIFLWHASKKSTFNTSRYLWYAFVWLNGWPETPSHPRVFFAHSSIVSQRVQGCLDNDEWPFFWFKEEEAPGLEGIPGFKPLLECLDAETNYRAK